MGLVVKKRYKFGAHGEGSCIEQESLEWSNRNENNQSTTAQHDPLKNRTKDGGRNVMRENARESATVMRRLERIRPLWQYDRRCEDAQ